MADSLRYKVAIVGAAETTELGNLPNMSTTQLHVDATVNAIKDCGIDKNQIDGIATTMNPAIGPLSGDCASLAGQYLGGRHIVSDTGQARGGGHSHGPV